LHVVAAVKELKNRIIRKTSSEQLSERDAGAGYEETYKVVVRLFLKRINPLR
jgi:hypothetical protein